MTEEEEVEAAIQLIVDSTNLEEVIGAWIRDEEKYAGVFIPITGGRDADLLQDQPEP